MFTLIWKDISRRIRFPAELDLPIQLLVDENFGAVCKVSFFLAPEYLLEIVNFDNGVSHTFLSYYHVYQVSFMEEADIMEKIIFSKDPLLFIFLINEINLVVVWIHFFIFY